MFYLNCRQLFNNCCRQISRSISRVASHQNHYETLHLKSDCTSKQIRDAFIKLSKENHPDVNKDKNSVENFQKINEAYNVLSKLQSRQSYDSGLKNQQFYQCNPNNSYANHFYHPSRRYKVYYGHGKPKQRLPNSTVIVGCFLFMLLGVTLQYHAMRRSVAFKMELIRKYNSELDELMGHWSFK